MMIPFSVLMLSGASVGVLVGSLVRVSSGSLSETAGNVCPTEGHVVKYQRRYLHIKRVDWG